MSRDCLRAERSPSPPRLKGWQRNSRQIASPVPRIGPCVAIAMEAYSEQVGTKRQPPPAERVYRRRQPAAIKLEQSKKNACHRAGSALLERAAVRVCTRLLRIGLLENTHNLRLKFREFDRQHRPVRMEDQVAARWATGLHAAADTSRSRRLMRLRSCALPSTLPTVSPTRGPACLYAPAPSPETSSSKPSGAFVLRRRRVGNPRAYADARQPETGDSAALAARTACWAQARRKCSSRNWKDFGCRRLARAKSANRGRERASLPNPIGELLSRDSRR